MTKPIRTKNELRCFCSRAPLLAMYGLDVSGTLYIHVRVYKQERIFANIVAYGGKVKIMCRECLRWHSVRIIEQDRAKLEETSAPSEVPPPPMFQPKPETAGKL